MIIATLFGLAGKDVEGGACACVRWVGAGRPRPHCWRSSSVKNVNGVHLMASACSSPYCGAGGQRADDNLPFVSTHDCCFKCRVEVDGEVTCGGLREPTRPAVLDHARGTLIAHKGTTLITSHFAALPRSLCDGPRRGTCTAMCTARAQATPVRRPDH